jgi:hypothetical protein
MGYLDQALPTLFIPSHRNRATAPRRGLVMPSWNETATALHRRTHIRCFSCHTADLRSLAASVVTCDKPVDWSLPLEVDGQRIVLVDCQCGDRDVGANRGTCSSSTRSALSSRHLASVHRRGHTQVWNHGRRADVPSPESAGQGTTLDVRSAGRAWVAVGAGYQEDEAPRNGLADATSGATVRTSHAGAGRVGPLEAAHGMRCGRHQRRDRATADPCGSRGLEQVITRAASNYPHSDLIAMTLTRTSDFPFTGGRTELTTPDSKAVNSAAAGVH